MIPYSHNFDREPRFGFESQGKRKIRVVTNRSEIVSTNQCCDHESSTRSRETHPDTVSRTGTKREVREARKRLFRLLVPSIGAKLIRLLVKPVITVNNVGREPHDFVRLDLYTSQFSLVGRLSVYRVYRWEETE